MRLRGCQQEPFSSIGISSFNPIGGRVMSRCELTGKGPAVSNRVSHSNIKTKTRSFPNVQYKHVFSNALNESIRFKLATSTIRDLEHRGSFDAFILKQDDEILSKRALDTKKRILRKFKPKKA